MIFFQRYLGVGAMVCGVVNGLTAADVVDLAPVEVWSPRVALQEPAATFAMPVTAVRFESRVDVQARGFAEGQADVAIRGGTYANTGFAVAGLPLYDPQTGHYSAEIPLAPAMLTAPRVRVGLDQAREGWNATAGGIVYDWRPLHKAGGMVLVGAGQHGLRTGEIYTATTGSRGWAVDAGWAYSRGDGSRPDGDHEFQRAALRLQRQTGTARTDMVVGYQEKFFGWVNLYTPFNSPESEDLRTLLVLAQHRIEGEQAGDYTRVGLYFRRHDDDYRFNRYALVGPVRPFAHTSWVTGAGVDGRHSWGEAWALSYRAGAIIDTLTSTSLRFGRFNSRTQVHAGAFATRSWPGGGAEGWELTAGAVAEMSNRDADALVPSVGLQQRRDEGWLSRWGVAWAGTTQVASYTALNSSTSGGLFRGNPDLGRTRARTWELTAEGQAGEWQWESAVFRRDDRDLVDWVFRLGITAREARPVRIRTTGWEGYLQRSWGTLDLSLGGTVLHKNADYGDVTVGGSFYALNYPEYRGTAAVAWRFARGWELRMDNEVRRQAANPLRQIGGDEAWISAAGLYFRPPAAPAWLFAVQADNLWDRDFQEIPAVPAVGRQVVGSVRFHW
jgi:vitamin B12 transporter